MARSKPQIASFGSPLAPEPSDLEMMMAVEMPVEDFDDPDFVTGGTVMATLGKDWSSPEATAAGKNYVRSAGPPMRTLYDIKGESRSVIHTDVPALVDDSIPVPVRLYLRCPRCFNMDNRGIHPFAGPNGCP